MKVYKNIDFYPYIVGLYRCPVVWNSRLFIVFCFIILSVYLMFLVFYTYKFVGLFNIFSLYG